MQSDDRILLPVRIVAAILVPVLSLAVVMLYFLPGDTDRHWAWTINPELTAMFMGAGYACGAYFFARVLIGRSWRAVSLGFLPITAFTAFLFLATVLHWSRFDHGHVSFWIWTFPYFVTPILVPALWFANRRADPGRKPGELLLPPLVRGAVALAGGVVAALALFMLVTPTTIMDDWLWPLSELTARVVAAYIALTGGLLVMMAWDARWSAGRVLVETFIIGTILMPIAIVRDWDSLDPSSVVRWGYLLAVILGFVLLTALYVWMERQRRSLAAG